MLLKDKKLVIIGGTSGMGLSAARAFVKAGARVAIVGNVKNDILPVQHELGTSAVVMFGDATKHDCAKKAIERCILHFDGFDGLYHVAGGSGRKLGDGPLHEMTNEGWFKTIDLNLTSTMYSNQAAVRQFLNQKTGGTILNMGSVLGFSPAPKFFSTHAYAAAKAAIEGFSKSVAAFYATDDIRVNVITPALVETPMSQRASQNEEIMAFIREKQALGEGRIGSPDDLDGLAVYFMSDLSKFTTGQVVAVDGGWSVRG